jgi:antitoxin component of MazEF toxin-antitoxin module
MNVIIETVGTGLGFILPNEIVLESNIVAGVKYDVKSKDGEIVLTRKENMRTSYKLEDLLVEINPSNIHGEL